MAISRASIPKQTTPFGKGAKNVNPFGDKGKAAPPFGKKPKGFAKGGSVHKSAFGSNLDDGKPSGGGKSRGGGAAKKGTDFTGTF